MITTVLLDAGGVILDESEHERVRAQVIIETLASVVDGYALADYQSDIAEAINCYCPNVYDFVLWKRLQFDRALYLDLHERYLSMWRRESPPLKLMDGIGDELSQLSEKFNIGIAGQYGREIVELLEDYDLLKHFKWSFTQNDFRTTKPDPRFYEELMRSCGVVASECVMVGDRIDKDIAPARLLRMKTILVRNGLHAAQQPRMLYEEPDIDMHGITGLAVSINRLTASTA